MDNDVKRYLLNTVAIIVWIVAYYYGMKLITKASRQWRKFLGHSDWEQW